MESEIVLKMNQSEVKFLRKCFDYAKDHIHWEMSNEYNCSGLLMLKQDIDWALPRIEDD